MTVTNWASLLPLLFLAGTAVASLLCITIFRSHRLVASVTLLGMLAALISVMFIRDIVTQSVTPLLLVNRFTLLYIALLLFAGVIIAMLSFHYWEMQAVIREEYYPLLLLAVLGGAVMCASSHFASFFLGLEILSVSLYGLVAYRRDNLLGLEAGLKYLILAGTSSAFILFGMAMVYAAVGSMQLTVIIQMYVAGLESYMLALIGFGMIIIGMSFKLALFPFHLWTPDVYEGAPLPVAALIATVSKGAVFGLLLKFFSPLLSSPAHALYYIFSALTIASMFTGNFLALRQNNIKRLLAYSSIANMGYLLTAFLAGGAFGLAAATFYLATYFVSILAAFGVMCLLSSPERDADFLHHYRSLAWRRPWLAAIMTTAMLSLAGMPLTAGFMGKFFLFTAGIGMGKWVLMMALLVNSGISLFFYLRVVREMYRMPDEAGDSTHVPLPMARPVTLLNAVALGLVALLLVGLGLYPAPLMQLTRIVLRDIFP